MNENSLSEEKWVSVINSNCSKGNSLKILVEYLDISMFEVSEMSVTVSNASENKKIKLII